MYKMVCVDAIVILELSHNIKMKYDDREFSYNLLHYMISLGNFGRVSLRLCDNMLIKHENT